MHDGRAPMVTLRLTSAPSSRRMNEVGPVRCTRYMTVLESRCSVLTTACVCRRRERLRLRVQAPAPACALPPARCLRACVCRRERLYAACPAAWPHGRQSCIKPRWCCSVHRARCFLGRAAWRAGGAALALLRRAPAGASRATAPAAPTFLLLRCSSWMSSRYIHIVAFRLAGARGGQSSWAHRPQAAKARITGRAWPTSPCTRGTFRASPPRAW